MDDSICSKIDEITPHMISSIKDIVRIKSVEESPEVDAPYGKGPKEALDFTLELARSLGFKTVNVDNHMGYASFGPTGNGYIAAVGHLDVVPEGEGWKEPPYSGHEADGVIYSRGVLDNKGPIYTCLFALYALKELGFKPVREIRILFGTNEETGFNDLKHYLTVEKPPVLGFTPDCKYPVVYAERGRAQIAIVGDAANLDAFFDMLNTYVLNAKPNGERFGIDYTDQEFGTLEVRNYKVTYNPQPRLSFALSYPAGLKATDMVATIQEKLPCMQVELESDMEPVRFQKDCRLVDTLKDTFERITGMDGTPVTTTGGTYAKLMPNIVPFGPSFPGQKGIGHQPNEWMNISDLVLNAKIYALSLYELSKEL